MSWKEYFYYTNSERKGIFTLVFLVFIALIMLFLIDFLFVEKDKEVDFSEEIYRFKNRAYFEEYEKNKSFSPTILNPKSNFDPNTVSENILKEIGFNKMQIRNIINYRKAGGIFYNKEDLKNIYTISDKQYEQIKDFIVIKTSIKPNKTEEKAQDYKRDFDDKQYKEERYKSLNIELNSATKEDLIKVYGIGEVLSERIIKYRDYLGGFYSINQLAEVYGIDSAKFVEVSENFTIDNSLIKKIDINNASNFDLKRHPYIDEKLAYKILNRKRQQGDFKSLEQLKNIDGIKENDYKKIKHYLTVK
jgi:DNA uptake protein ComE-like DNA-binding protein